uniref:Uncharacterized protein n=1 Tax=Laticauda laticaudata TaxID=8630 RepID=A0A8C5REA8_LATLA
MTIEASFRAREAFISPSAAMTWKEKKTHIHWTGNFTSLISTRSTFMPQSSVASSKVAC